MLEVRHEPRQASRGAMKLTAEAQAIRREHTVPCVSLAPLASCHNAAENKVQLFLVPRAAQ